MCAIVLPTVNIGHQGSVAQWELFFQLQLHECCLMASSCSSTECLMAENIVDLVVCLLFIPI